MRALLLALALVTLPALAAGPGGHPRNAERQLDPNATKKPWVVNLATKKPFVVNLSTQQQATPLATHDYRVPSAPQPAPQQSIEQQYEQWRPWVIER